MQIKEDRGGCVFFKIETMKNKTNLEEIITSIQNDNSIFTTEFVITHILDPLFRVSQDTIGENLIILNQSRNVIRLKHMEEGKIKYKAFQDNWRKFKIDIEQLKLVVENVEYNKKLLKLINTLLELIERSTQRPVMSKFIVPDIDFLQVEATEVGIDWIINKIKSYLNKFAQAYTSTRVYYLLSNTLN
ncbi:MAG TPA: hypothetical protein DCS93_28290 [Microscillaceae bacterium]|nr:hypothetical protein [Microscillaceae bacterium]